MSQANTRQPGLMRPRVWIRKRGYLSDQANWPNDQFLIALLHCNLSSMMSRVKPSEEALLTTPDDESAQQAAAREAALTRLRAMRLAAIRMRPHDWLSGGTQERLREEVAQPLAALLAEGVQLLEGLSAAEPTDHGEYDVDGLDLAWDAVESSSDSHLALSPDDGLGDVAFTARLELRKAASRLQSAGSREEVIVACDRGRRKLQRCIEAILESAPQARPPTTPPGASVSALESAVIVRAAYGQFRESIPPCDPSDPQSVTRAIRTSVNAVSRLLGGRAYEHVRHADRLMLRALQQRMVDWARSPEFGAGVRLHKDLMTTADLMRDINHRQELLEHDQVALRRLQRLLHSSSLERAAREELVALLQTLRGRNDELDACMVEDCERLEESCLVRLRGVVDELVPCLGSGPWRLSSAAPAPWGHPSQDDS